MLILWLEMYEYDMDLLLIKMDNNKIHNSFEFKSYLGIKYQEVFHDFAISDQRHLVQFMMLNCILHN